jgi:cytochrome c oxidase subunit III
MRRERVVADVSQLPTVVYGARNLASWGTTGFLIIEGFTLALCAVTYIYLRKNTAVWPPHGTSLPDLLIPSINMGLMLASIPLALWTIHRAERLDLAKTRIGLVLSSLVAVAVIVLRFYEFRALNTRWNVNAYGSIVWTILGLHGTLLLIDVYDTIGITAIMFVKPESKWFPEVADNSIYWIFTVLSWLGLYVLVYFGPRML